jgi:hypothetical protein
VDREARRLVDHHERRPGREVFEGDEAGVGRERQHLGDLVRRARGDDAAVAREQAAERGGLPAAPRPGDR